MINFRQPKQLKELHDAYLEALTARGKRRPTMLSYSTQIIRLIDFLGLKGISAPEKITQEHLFEYQQFLYKERDFTQSSVCTYFKIIRMFLDYVVETGYLEENIVINIKILPEPEAPQQQLAHFYTFDEVLRRYLGHERHLVSYGYLTMIEKHLNGFIKYLKSNNLKSVYVVTEKTLLDYRDFLWDDYVYYRQSALVIKSQIDRLRCVVRLFRYLYKEGILKENPARSLDWENYYKLIVENAKLLPPKVLEHKDLTEMDKLMFKFLDYERARNKNEKTVRHYKKAVEVFFEYLKQKGIQNLTQVTKRTTSEYFIYLCSYVGVRGAPATNRYKNMLLWGVKLFFSFLVRGEYLSKDPTADLESVREDSGLPKAYMNEKEVFALIDRPRINNNPLGHRDKAMLSVLFSTGIRCNELANLNLEDIDYQNGMLRVNVPKGGAKNQRIIPIDSATLEIVKSYITDVRSTIENCDSKSLFVSFRGRRLINYTILTIVKKYAFECGFRKNITTHSLRITCATLLYKNGADIRYIQEQLGHRDISSTQIYTRLVPKDLKAVHSKCHPLERKKATNYAGRCYDLSNKLQPNL